MESYGDELVLRRRSLGLTFDHAASRLSSISSFSISVGVGSLLFGPFSPRLIHLYGLILQGIGATREPWRVPCSSMGTQIDGLRVLGS